MQTTYKRLKAGTLFQFVGSPVVWLRCRGGFRHGLGGELYRCPPDTAVIPYSTDFIVAQELADLPV